MNAVETVATPGSVQRRPISTEAEISVSPVPADAIRKDIEKLAYALWEKRGCPIGSAENDWIEAEQQIRR